jgi:hypothetical protein
MRRMFITRKRFYEIRRFYKRHYVEVGHIKIRQHIVNAWDLSQSTLSRILMAKNFKEYKLSGNVYGKGVKVLRKRYIFILFLVGILALMLNLILG